MSHPDKVEDEGVRGHSNASFPIRPLQKLVSLMFKNGRLKNTLLAIADRAGDHAVMTSDAGGKPIQERRKIFDHPF